MSDPEAPKRLPFTGDPRLESLREFLRYYERAAIVVLGLTVASLAGFLSQVWGSGGVPFRTELAELLKRAGGLFLMSWGLPLFGMIVPDAAEAGKRRSILFMVGWLVLVGILSIKFGGLLREAADTILRHARIPTPN